MRNFNEINPDEKIAIRISLSAKHAAILQKEAKSKGLTMSGYLTVYLQNLLEEDHNN